MPRGNVTPDGRHLTTLRGEAGLTQVELARRAGFGVRTISKIESGRPTSASTLAAITTVLTRKLGREVRPEELLRQRRTTPADELRVAERVKVLDLRGWPARGGLLHDLVRLRAARGREEFRCHYATTGTELEGRCVSHPASWAEITDFGTTCGWSGHLARCYELRVKLGFGTEVRNEVRYLDGFADRPREWFHSHICLPTDRLTLLIWFPTARPFRVLRGLVQEHPAGPFHPAGNEPVLVPGGELAHWTLEAPRMGWVYQVEWEW